MARTRRHHRLVAGLVGISTILLGIPLAAPRAIAGQDMEGFMPDTLHVAVGDMVFDAIAAGPAGGDLVLLLHGFPQTSHSFRHQLSALARAGYRAVAPDQRGYSPGARPARAEDYAMTHLVGDVIGIVDALGHSTFHLIGHDWGGAVAWVTAATFPESVMSLVAVSTTHLASFSAAMADSSSGQAQRSSYMQVFAAEGTEHAMLANDAATLRSIYAGAGLSDRDVDVYVHALRTPEALRAALNWYTASGLRPAPSAGGTSSSRASSLPPVRVPTMYVWSTEDVAFSRVAAEGTQDWVTGPYRFEVLEGISHWVPEQAAERLSELILEHLGSLQRPRS